MTLDTFYQSKQWVNLVTRIRLERLTAAGETICEYCGRPITKQYDCIAHHKIYLTEQNVNDATVALNPDNIALVHMRCHNLIHHKYGHPRRKVYLVWGSPLSGKTTYALDNMEPGDLILDIDRIWECVSGLPEYKKPDSLKANVFRARDLLIEQVQHRVGGWNTAWIVGGYPYDIERNKLAGSLCAEQLRIDTPEDQCLERLKLKNDGRDEAEWTKYIERWWQTVGSYQQ